MIILGLTDIHGDVSNVDKFSDKILEADVILLVGDITNFGREVETKLVVDKIREYNSNVFAVSGNCDYSEVDAWLDQEGLNIHGKGVVINGIGFIGVGGSLVTPFNTPNEISEDDFQRAMEKGIADLPKDIPFVLVTHQPPFQTKCDRLSSGMNVGSKSVRDFIEHNKPLICFSGHIHEARGVDRVGETDVINPGQFGAGRYSYARISDKVEEILIQF